MKKRSGKDRRRFKRLNERRKQLVEDVSNAPIFGIIMTLIVSTVIVSYFFIASQF